MALQVMLRQDLIIETAFNTQVNGSMSGSDYFVLCILIDLTRVRFIFLDSWPSMIIAIAQIHLNTKKNILF